jgi:hypothetical protein
VSSLLQRFLWEVGCTSSSTQLLVVRCCARVWAVEAGGRPEAPEGQQTREPLPRGGGRPRDVVPSMFWLIHSICNHDLPMTSSLDEVASTLEAVVGWLLADGYLTLRTDSESVGSTTCRLSSAHSLSHGSSWSETFVFGPVELRNSLVPDTCSKLDVVAWAGDCFAQVLVSITERFGHDSVLTCRHLRSTAMLNCCAAV